MSSWKKHFIQILSKFYPNFIHIFLKLTLTKFIWISGENDMDGPLVMKNFKKQGKDSTTMSAALNLTIITNIVRYKITFLLQNIALTLYLLVFSQKCLKIIIYPPHLIFIKHT